MDIDFRLPHMPNDISIGLVTPTSFVVYFSPVIADADYLGIAGYEVILISFSSLQLRTRRAKTVFEYGIVDFFPKSKSCHSGTWAQLQWDHNYVFILKPMVYSLLECPRHLCGREIRRGPRTVAVHPARSTGATFGAALRGLEI